MPNNEFGDFQTPFELAMQCLRRMHLSEDARILEPTCGRGAFLRAAQVLAPKSERRGIEINQTYVNEAAQWGDVRQENIFNVSLSKEIDWQNKSSLFIVGNPPWVTAAELQRMGSDNLPKKENFKSAKGLAALLGSANFDVCEYIILKVLRELSHMPFSLGMLCKTHVARKVIEYSARERLSIKNAVCYRIDTKKWFNADVEACWFMLEMNALQKSDYTVKLYNDLFQYEEKPEVRFGIVDSLMVADIDKYTAVRVADGVAPYEWRSGLKHDASSVFELQALPKPATKDGQILDLEERYVFPLLKSTDIFRARERQLTKWVIVPQMEFGADTSHLRATAPKLWNYLESHAAVLDRRKSTIYKNRPRFSVFGHGAYTFAPYKVAISALHKQPVFRLITPLNGQPVVLDDTCYFLSFDDATEAILVTVMLNSRENMNLIESLVFWEAKRPITKKLLARLDLNRLPVKPAEIIAHAVSLAESLKLPFDKDRASKLIGHFGAEKTSADTLF